jgi:hypothetical protein
MINTQELEPINGIRVFTVSGPTYEVENMATIIPERHMIFVTQFEDEEDENSTEIFWQGLHFFNEDMNWYSLVQARDKTVEKIIDTTLAQVLCCQTFFDHLGLRAGKVTEVIEISTLPEKGVYLIDSDADLDGKFERKDHVVKAEIGNILTAIDLLILDICLSNYLEVARDLYPTTRSGYYTKAKHVVGKLRKRQNKFAEGLDKVPFV